MRSLEWRPRCGPDRASDDPWRRQLLTLFRHCLAAESSYHKVDMNRLQHRPAGRLPIGGLLLALTALLISVSACGGGSSGRGKKIKVLPSPPPFADFVREGGRGRGEVSSTG